MISDDDAIEGKAPNPRRGEPRPPTIIDAEALEPRAPEPDSGADASNAGPESSPKSFNEGDDARVSGEAIAPAEEAVVAPSEPRRGVDRMALAALGLAALAAIAASALWSYTLTQNYEAREAALGSQIDQLNRKVESLQSSVQANAAAARAAQAQAEKAQADGRAQADKAQADRAQADRAASANAAQSSDQGALTGAAVAAQAMVSSRLSGLSAQGDALTADVKGLQKRASDLGAAVTALGRRIDPLEGLLNAPKLDVAALQADAARAVGNGRSAALVVVARSLAQAVEAGKPYANELDAARRLGADASTATRMQASAASGAPTAAALADSFSSLVGPILAGSARAPSGGVWDRLTGEFGRLVTIRTTGGDGGSDPASLVGTIEDDLRRGDVAAALKARDRLPAAAQKVTDAWATKAQAHAVAQDGAQALLAQALDGLGKPPS